MTGAYLTKNGAAIISRPPPAVDLPDYDDDDDPRELRWVLRSFLWSDLIGVLVICLVGALLVFVLIPLAVGAEEPEPLQPACDRHVKIVQFLDRRYSERPAAFGVQNDGRLLEIFLSETGSWTAIVSRPDGRSCIVAGGTHWSQPMGSLVAR